MSNQFDVMSPDLCLRNRERSHSVQFLVGHVIGRQASTSPITPGVVGSLHDNSAARY